MDNIKLGGFPPLILKKTKKQTKTQTKLKPLLFSNKKSNNINIRELIFNKKTSNKENEELESEELEELEEI